MVNRKNRRNWAIVLKTQGKTIYTINKKQLISDHLHPVILPKGCDYSWICIEAGECIIIEFDAEITEIDFNSFEIKENSFIINNFSKIEKSLSRKNIGYKLECMKHYDTLSDSKEIILHSLILELIYTITKDSTKRIKNGNSNNTYTLIEKSLQYIKEHITEDLALETVAKAMSMSPIHFHNTFKTAVGKTLREYIEEQRIKKATNLLLTTNHTLTQIAFECGFSSQSYFSYVFKRKMKVTPREYVREVYNKYEK